MLLEQDLSLHLEQILFDAGRSSGPACLPCSVILLIVLVNKPIETSEPAKFSLKCVVDYSLVDDALDHVHVKWAILILLDGFSKESDSIDCTKYRN